VAASIKANANTTASTSSATNAVSDQFVAGVAIGVGLMVCGCCAFFAWFLKAQTESEGAIKPLAD
jgi:hypothetical protein